jgi:hypothetical protein
MAVATQHGRRNGAEIRFIVNHENAETAHDARLDRRQRAIEGGVQLVDREGLEQ